MYSRFIIVARLAPSYFCFLSSSLSDLIHRSCSSNDALPVRIDVSQETSEENKKRKRTTRRVKEKIIIWADIETHRYTSLSLPAEGGKLRATATKTTARLARLSTHTDRTSVSTKDHINSSLSPSSVVGFFSLCTSQKDRVVVAVVFLFVTLFSCFFSVQFRTRVIRQ